MLYNGYRKEGQVNKANDKIKIKSVRNYYNAI